MAILKCKTESVKLFSRFQSGIDGFRKPTYTETEIEIPGVLVETLGSQDLLSTTDMSGKLITYKLHIPKGDTNSWENTYVYVRGHKCKTIGLEEKCVNPPLDWDKTIKAEYHE